MRHFLFSVRLVVLALVGLSFARPSSAAQVQFAKAVVSSQNVAAPALAVDESAATAATLSAPSLLGTARLRLSFDSVVPEGGTAGLIIRAGSNLDLALFSGITIRTYMNSGTGYEESLSLGSLVDLSVLSSTGKATVEFPVHKPFNQVELRIAGLLSASFDVDLFSAYGTLAAPLPVELLGFEGRSTAAGVALVWSTASERNSDYFEVERAEGSPEYFHRIGRVAAAGTVIHRTDYRLLDASPAPLGYYRLRQVDRDGTVSFSPLVLVRGATPAQRLAVYPSPATETVVVAAAPGTAFAVFDQLGRQVRAGEVPPGGRPVLDVRALPAGVYLVRDLSTGHSTRFVKAGAE